MTEPTIYSLFELPFLKRKVFSHVKHYHWESLRRLRKVRHYTLHFSMSICHNISVITPYISVCHICHNISVITPYISVCHICHRKFSNNSLLHRHVKTVHMKILPAKCDLCEQRFRDNHSALAHKRAHHLGILPYMCDECRQSCWTKADLKKHKQQCHSVTWGIL